MASKKRVFFKKIENIEKNRKVHPLMQTQFCYKMSKSAEKSGDLFCLAK